MPWPIGLFYLTVVNFDDALQVLVNRSCNNHYAYANGWFYAKWCQQHFALGKVLSVQWINQQRVTITMTKHNFTGHSRLHVSTTFCTYQLETQSLLSTPCNCECSCISIKLYECVSTAPLKGTRSTNYPDSYIVLFKENLSKEVGKHFILLQY